MHAMGAEAWVLSHTMLAMGESGKHGKSDSAVTD